MRKHFFWTCFLLFSMAIGGFSESGEVSLSSKEVSNDKDFFMASAEVIGSNFLIWGFDYFVLQAQYARISPETWKNNLMNGFEWDNDLFFVNQMLHPYQGSLYFNSARSNGFSFWESVPFTLGGSLTWEYFMEKNNPSINDFITTSLGGIILGESSHRLSQLFLNNRGHGYKRVIREFAAAVINPIDTVNKMLQGNESSPEIKGKQPYSKFSVLSGMSRTRDEEKFFGASPSAFIGIQLQYGDPYNSEETYAPYDYFYFNFDLAANINNPTYDIFAHAILSGHKLYIGKRSLGLIGLFQHFDYLENYTYKFASNGVGGGLQFFFPLPKEKSLEFTAHLYGIALGGVDSDYSKQKDNRNYSLGSGCAVKTGMIFENDSVYRLKVTYHKYWFQTLSGSDNHNIVGMFSISGEYFISKDVQLGISYFYFDRWSDAAIDRRNTYGTRIYLNHYL